MSVSVFLGLFSWAVSVVLFVIVGVRRGDLQVTAWGLAFFVLGFLIPAFGALFRSAGP